MEKRRRSAGMLTPSPSLSGGSSDEADLDAEVDYDQAYRMLAVTLGFENSRDATSLDVAAGGGGNPIQGSGSSGPPQGQQDLLSPQVQGPPQFPTLPSPGVPGMPGAHGFSNPSGSGSVTMPTPMFTNTQPMTSSPQPVTSPLPQQQQMPQFMASMRQQGSVFPTANAMMLQSLFGGNSGRDNGSRGGNYNNPLVTFMRTLFQQQQQQMQSGNHGNSNGNSMANIFNNIPEQILMENMFNFNQNNVNNNQQQPPSNRKSFNHQQKRHRTSGGKTPRGTAGYHNLQNQRSNPSAAPWGFYLNRDESDVMFPPFTPPPRHGCPGNG